MKLRKTFRFEASHILPNHPGKCSNLHGHSWVLHVEVNGPIDPSTGMVQDYSDIKSTVSPVVDDLDHAHLGAWSTSKIEIDFAAGCAMKGTGTKTVSWLDKDGSDKFNPTSENLLVEIAKQLVKRSFVFSSLSLEETCTCSCTLTWEEFRGITSKQTQP